MHQLFIFVLYALLVQSDGVINKLNETEYYKMPPLYFLDDYDICMVSPEATYCIVDFNLEAGINRELMRTIQEYSANKIKHFNHTQIHRGICVTNTCKRFMNSSVTNETDLREILDACFNDTVYSEYGLEGKLADVHYCNKADETMEIDTLDIIVAVIYFILIMLNVIGSFYNIVCCQKENKDGNPYLLAFSIRRNWLRLTAPSSNAKEPRLDKLKLFNGLRTMTMICVFFAHTALVMSYSYVQNTLYIETSYDDPLKQLIFSGTLVTQTFFIMSSMLLAYNFMLHTETRTISWMYLAKGILLRWLRLSPTYALVLATIMTWMRHLYKGPLWPLVVTSEAVACRQYWWAQLLYINNYVYDDANCMPQTWYLAADTQLFCIGLLVCILARTNKARGVILTMLMILALAVVAGHTYFQDLNAFFLQSPESFRNLFATDASFRLMYVRGHTNITSAVTGLATGFLAYHWQNNKSLDTFKKYRWLVWLAFPLGVATVLSGGVFYTDGGRAPMLWRVLYGTFYKPVFQFLLITIILGCMFQFESVYRSILEWRGFTWTGRVSYSAFLLHFLFQRGLVGVQRQPIYISDYYVFVVLSATVLITYIAAVVLWLCVEAPGAALTRAIFAKSDTATKDTTRTIPLNTFYMK